MVLKSQALIMGCLVAGYWDWLVGTLHFSVWNSCCIVLKSSNLIYYFLGATRLGGTLEAIGADDVGGIVVEGS